MKALLGLALLLSTARAEPTLRFDYLGVEHGMPSSSVGSITQDHDGFMWFAVPGGLARYDGYRIRVFRANPDDRSALSHPHVTAMYVDRSGTLWAGTRGGHLHRFDAKREVFDRWRWDPETDPQRPDDHEMKDQPVHPIALFEDRGGTFWVGTSGGGLRVFDRDRLEFSDHLTTNNERTGSNAPLSFYDGGDGWLWIGSWEDGVTRLNKATGEFQVFADELSNRHVKGIVPGRDGRVWIGTIGGGLNVYDPKTHTVAQYDTPEDALWINSIHSDGSGVLWLATETSGLIRFDPLTEDFTRYTIPNGHYSVMTMFEDRDHTLWLAPRIGGVFRFPLSLSRFVYYRHDPDNDNSPTGGHVTDIYVAPDGNLWMANADGLDHFDTSTRSFTRYKPDTDPSVSPRNYLHAVTPGPDGAVWICSINTGLKRFDPRSERFTHFRHDEERDDTIASDSCEDLVFDGNTLWIATHKGLDRFDLATGGFEHFLPDERTFSVLVDSQSRVWAGTETGLKRVDPTTAEVATFTYDEDQPQCLGPGHVVALFEDSRRVLWSGTSFGALSRLNEEEGTFDVYWPNGIVPNKHERGYYGWSISDIRESHGALWMATGTGLYRMNPADQSFEHFASGVDDVERTYKSLGLGKDALYLGGLMGLTVFHPDDHVGRASVERPVTITSVVVRDESGKIIRRGHAEDALRLEWGERVLDIEFAALTYQHRKLLEYEYKLEGGAHTEWVQTNTPSVTFASLGPGKYEFLVRAKDQDDSGAVAALVMTVDPPPWRTWWAYFTYAMLAFVVAAGSLRYREQRRERIQLAQWNQELERRIAEATREVSEAEEALIRTSQLARFGEFAASVAHDLKTPLTFIRGELELLEEAHQRGEVDDELLASTIQALLDHCRRMRGEIETAMAYVRPSESGLHRVGVKSLFTEVRRMLRVRANQLGVTARIDVPMDVTAHANVDGLRHVIANLVVNALEAMPSGGRLTLSASTVGEFVEIRVIDTGLGVPEQLRATLFETFASTKGEQGTGLGLSSCQRLIEDEMGGEISLESSRPGRTSFLIRLRRAEEEKLAS